MRIIYFWASSTAKRPQQLPMYPDLASAETTMMFLNCQKGRRPNSAPAYYLGHPAGLWITAMRPRRERTASRYTMQAVTGGGQTPARHGGHVTGTGAETACVTPPNVPLLIIGARAQ